MYVSTQKSGKSTKAVGVTAAVAMTVGMAALFSSMNMHAEKILPNTMELVMLPPPPPPPIIEEPEPPKVEVVEEQPAPPAPPELVAPDIEFVPDEIPVITAPVADPVPVPDPLPVAPAPPVQSRSTPQLIAGDKPAYPSASRRNGEAGTTKLEICVNAAGRVTSASVAGSSGYQRLDDAALKWIRGERFRPGKVNGVSQDMCGYNMFYQWTLQDT